jgi:hypothetical protein
VKAGFALNIERLYGPGIVRVAAKHLLRELAAELGADSHIDAARMKDNFILRGPDTSAGVAALAKSLMEAAGVTKCRKGAVTALELLFTLPAAATINPRRYFEQATAWAEQYFGVPVLSCVAHMDEGAPHAHALLLPLVGGRMGGSDLHGGKAKLAAMQTNFHEVVGAPHGLPKFAPQKRISAPVRAAAMALARESLQTNAALNDDIIDALLVPHAKDPAPLLLALGIAMPTPKPRGKDFVSMMVAVCKPEPRKPIGKQIHKPIGKAIQGLLTPAFPESSVGKRNPASPNPAHAQPPQPAADHATSTADQRQHSAEDSAQQQAVQVEQREARTGAADQSAEGMQNPLHTSAPAAGEPVPASDSAAPAKRRRAAAKAAPVARGIGKISDTPTGDQTLASMSTAPDQVKTGKSGNACAAASLAPIRGHPSKSGDTLTGATLQTQQVEQRAAGDYQRQRDGDHLAATWCSDRGEFVSGSGPPPSACHLHR